MTSGIKASNSREQAQEAEITILKDLVENQQSRLHRMQKELQFLVTRQKVLSFLKLNQKLYNIYYNTHMFESKRLTKPKRIVSAEELEQLEQDLQLTFGRL